MAGGLRVKLTPQEQEPLDNLDKKLISYVGGALDEGLRFIRWLVFTELLREDQINKIKEDTGAVGYYSGVILKKEQTIFFYLPRFN